MRKTVVSASLLALSLVLALAATAAAPGDAGVAPQAAPEVAPEVALPAGEIVLPEAPPTCGENASRPAADGAPLFLAPIPPPDWPCPFGAPRCRKHDDCDAYCGDPRFGWCFDDGCCGCSG